VRPVLSGVEARLAAGFLVPARRDGFRPHRAGWHNPPAFRRMIGRIPSVAFRQGTASAVPQESEGNAALAAEVRKRTCETQPLNQRDLTAVGEMQPAGQAAVLRRRVRILRLSTSGRRSLRIRRIRYARKRTSGSRWTGSAHTGRTGHPHQRAASNPHRRRQ
jgi:hypothetical protein